MWGHALRLLEKENIQLLKKSSRNSTEREREGEEKGECNTKAMLQLFFNKTQQQVLCECLAEVA